LMQIKVLVKTIAEVMAWIAVATVLIEIAPLERSGELQLQLRFLRSSLSCVSKTLPEA
jgi:hypothetical protein